MMIKLKNIAQYLNAEIVGNGHLEIKGILRNPEFKENYITVVNQEEVKMQNSINEDRRRIALLTIKVQKEFNCLIAPKKDIMNKFIKLLNLFKINESFYGIHPSIIVGRNVKIEQNISIGANSVLGDNVEIGENTIIYPNVTIYPNVKIGSNCKIHSGVVIKSGVEIGNNVEIDTNTSIGCNSLEKGIRKIHNGKLSALPFTGRVIIKNKALPGFLWIQA